MLEVVGEQSVNEPRLSGNERPAEHDVQHGEKKPKEQQVPAVPKTTQSIPPKTACEVLLERMDCVRQTSPESSTAANVTR